MGKGEEFGEMAISHGSRLVPNSRNFLLRRPYQNDRRTFTEWFYPRSSASLLDLRQLSQDLLVLLGREDFHKRQRHARQGDMFGIPS